MDVLALSKTKRKEKCEIEFGSVSERKSDDLRGKKLSKGTLGWKMSLRPRLVKVQSEQVWVLISTSGPDS